MWQKTNVTAFQSTRISIDRTPARPTQDAVCRRFLSMQGEAAPPIAAYMQTQDMQKERAVHFSKLRGRGISSNRPFCEICGAINIYTPRNVVSATRLLARAKHVLKYSQSHDCLSSPYPTLHLRAVWHAAPAAAMLHKTTQSELLRHPGRRYAQVKIKKTKETTPGKANRQWGIHTCFT